MPLIALLPRDRICATGQEEELGVGGEWKNGANTYNRVGVFSTLTNSYALVAVGASENFYRYVEAASPVRLWVAHTLCMDGMAKVGKMEEGRLV